MKWQLLSHAIRQQQGAVSTACPMKVLVATDAWRPQVNGVVRTLGSLARAASKLGVEIEFPVARTVFPHFRCRPIPACGSPCRAGGASPSASKRQGLTPFTSRPKVRSVSPCAPIAAATAGRSRPATRRDFPEYISARSPIPAKLDLRGAAVVPRRRDRDHGGDAVADERAWPSAALLNLGMWTRGVDIDLFRPDRAIDLDLPRPIFMTVGRVAVEKNLEAFLSLDLPGSKVVIGAGPQEAKLKRELSRCANFSAILDNGVLAAHLASADVFVFPSRTDTFGIVQLEALASGVPVAAFPGTGPKDVVGDNPDRCFARGPCGRACLEALQLPREACRKFALDYSWENSARQFIGHVRKVANGANRELETAMTITETAVG
jgi:glycosyltransferase involved in cell wall biosynthesis